MSIWQHRPLNTLGKIYTGKTPPTKNEGMFGGLIPFATPVDLVGKIATTERTLTEKGAKYTKVVPAGSALVGCIGNIGKIAQALVPMSFNQQINAIEWGESINPNYGIHALNFVKREMILLASSTIVPILNKSNFAKIQIPVPSLAQQHHIAAILDKADELRTKRKRALEILDSLTQGLFLEMFGDLATNPKGFPSKPLASLVRSNDNINYEVVQPGDDCDSGVPLIRVGDLVGGRVRHAALKRIAPTIEASYKRSRLRGDEILVSCVGSTGVVALADESLKGFNIARAIARIPLAETTNRLFLAVYLKTDTVQRYFANELRTVSQPTLNIKQLSETKVVLPPIELQNDFARKAVAVDRQNASLHTSLQQLDALFSCLQHRAFRGEL